MRPLLIPTLAVALLAFAPAASAQLSARDEAKARFETGLKYYDAHDFESARIAFAQAYAVLQTPNVLVNLGRSELYSNHPVDALAHFDQVIADASAPADKRADAKRLRDEAFKKTGHLVVKTSPDAELKLDGRTVTPVPTPIHVMPGAHALEARLAGTSKPKIATVDARAGETTNVDLTFEREAATVAAPPIARPAAPASEPLVEPPAAAAEGSFWGWRSVGGLALLGAGAVALGMGTGFKVDQGSKADRVREIDGRLPPGACEGAAVSQDCRDLQSALDARNSDKARGDTLLVLGGASMVAGGVLVLTAALWPHRNQTSGLRIVPVSGPKHAGLILSSSF
ncbi:MAG TPA: hypothetical protein VLT33_49510 [Labilithrix sp.]|nr:hypothetical protein [Labilithrix sp.]